MGRVDAKTALVTGAAQGLGAAAAKALAAEGAVVFCSDIDGAGAENTAAEITSSGGRAFGFQHDAVSESDWASAIAFVTSRSDRLDVLVNNAGGGTFADFEALSLQEWRKITQLNLDSTFLGSQHGVKLMKGTGGGSIINMSSVAGLVGSPTVIPYSAAKGGVRLFSKSLALHCGARGYNIRVNSLHPGLIKTASGTEMASKAFGASAEEAEKMMASLHPIGRIGAPSDIAQAVVFLASDESAFITGAELIVDGGFTAQ